MVKKNEPGPAGDSGDPHAPLIENSKDLRMLARMMRSGLWEVPDKVYKYLPAELMAIIANKQLNEAGQTVPAKHTARTRLMAMRLLRDIVGQNADAILKLLPEEHIHRHEEGAPVSSDEQRIAILRAVAAEQEKRSIVGGGNGSSGNGNGSAGSGDD